MKKTRNRINSFKDRVKTGTKKTMSSLSGGIEKMEQDYELVFKAKKSHL